MIEKTPYVIARNLAEADEILNRLSLNRRAEDCVHCDGNWKSKCLSCPAGESCQFTVPVNCSQCPESFCAGDKDLVSNGGDNGGHSSEGNSGLNIGSIVGVGVGCIAALAIITYLIWRFVIKPKRASNPHQSVYEAGTNLAHHVEKNGASRMARRSSTLTDHSIASSAFTHASNIIQIAYIPNVTNRATPTPPTVLVPPVSPITIQHSEGNRESSQMDQHFSFQGNLRDSTYSGFSSFYDRRSYVSRASIASTIYSSQAQVQTSAQTGMRVKPAVVIVKSAGTRTPDRPPISAIDPEKCGGRPDSSVSNFSVSSTYLYNANSAQQGGTLGCKVGSGVKSNPSVSSTSLVSAILSKDNSGPSSIVSKSPLGQQGPFSDLTELKTNNIITPTLGPVMEETEYVTL